jgi:uncharacterized protein YhbP (UPF0306 family)
MDTLSGAGWGSSPADRRTQAAIASFLAAHSTLTLATAGADGQPMAASLFFASDNDLRLFWTSSAGSRHSQNLARQPRAAASVHNETWSWTEIAGVQLEGTAAVVLPGPARDAAQALYLAKFPFAAQFQRELERSDFYVLTPGWVRWIDNAQGFGHREERGVR